MRSLKRNGLLSLMSLLSLHAVSCGSGVAIPEPLPENFAAAIESGDSNPNEGNEYESKGETGTNSGTVSDPGAGNTGGSNTGTGSGGLQPARDIEEGTYYIANGDTSNCLEIVGDVDAPSDIQQAKCDLGKRQLFKISLGSSGQFTITNPSGTMALEISGSSSATTLVQRSLSNSLSQRFEIETFLDIVIPTYTIRSASSRLYLQLDSELDSSPIVQGVFNGQSRQLWTFLPAQ